MLRFGTAGIPLIAKGVKTHEALAQVRKLGLDAMELEFVHSVNITETTAPLVKKAAEENDVALTCHGSYYINFNSAESDKYEASKKRLINAAHIANMCGASSVAFHPGFYGKSAKEEAYQKVKTAIKEVVYTLKQNGNKIWIRPETTGKHTQFGTVQEILRLSQELEQVMPCIDYAHMRARHGINDKKGFAGILEEIEKQLGREALDNMHIQAAGVKFSEKGELAHMNMEECDLNYKAMTESWKEFKIKGIVISESPNIEGDALLMKRVYNG